MRVRTVSRERDEKLLAWLNARKQGVSVGKISASSGSAKGTITAACCRIMAADIAESGEPEDEVRRAYQ